MRSTLVFRAHDKVSNRYELCRLASRVTRRLHFASCDTQSAINDTFVSIAGGAEHSSSLIVPMEAPATRVESPTAAQHVQAIDYSALAFNTEDVAGCADAAQSWFAAPGHGPIACITELALHP